MHTPAQLKRKVGTAEDLHSIVKTMKVLAAVSIRQYEQAAESLGHYYRTIERGLQILLRKDPQLVLNALHAPRTGLGMVVFGSDQGMCGQLNDQIVAHALEELQRIEGSWSQRRLVVVGGRVSSRLEDAGQVIEEVMGSPSSLDAILPAVQQLLMTIDRWHTVLGLDHMVLCYVRHYSGASYRPETMRLLPIDRGWLEKLAHRPWPVRTIPTFTMDLLPLLDALTQEYLFVSLYRAFAESLASENASRLVSMQAAERNIEERLEELQTLYNQERQMAITSELLDIVSGFEALSG